MPTKWLQERAKGSKNGHGMPPHRAFCGESSVGKQNSDMLGKDAPLAAPSASIQPGTIVELHSLSTKELNGLQAEAGEYDKTKGRRGARLFDGRLLGVKVTTPPSTHPQPLHRGLSLNAANNAHDETHGGPHRSRRCAACAWMLRRRLQR